MGLQVRNWSKYQHYKDRNPPWIKLATDTFQHYDFGCLQDASKLLAICIITLAARTKDGSIPEDLTWIKNQCNLGSLIQDSHLKELINQGFIIVASKTLAVCKQSACLETEGEAEGETEEKPKKSSLGHRQTTDRFPEFWKAYPRKRKKQDALKKWKVKQLDAKADVIITDVQCRQIDDCRWRKGFVPDPTTYLNGERWEDEFTDAAPQASGNWREAAAL